jgi:histone H3/H4
MTEIEAAVPERKPRQKRLKLTRKGNTIPTLPASIVRRTAIDSMTRRGKKRPVISADILAALEQATEWFFEQVGEDLEVYSDHAKRRSKIDVTDVWALMKRQRVIGQGQELVELAQEFLPEDVLLNLQFPG